MIDFNAIIQMVAAGFTPVFGNEFPIGMAIEVFIAYLGFRTGNLVLTAAALFVLTFILTFMGYLPVISYIFMVIVAGIVLAYLIFLKPHQGQG